MRSTAVPGYSVSIVTLDSFKAEEEAKESTDVVSTVPIAETNAVEVLDALRALARVLEAREAARDMKRTTRTMDQIVYKRYDVYEWNLAKIDPSGETTSSCRRSKKKSNDESIE
jgi:uncharacterized protein with von Willebrand factor type A (vWA) domain